MATDALDATFDGYSCPSKDYICHELITKEIEPVESGYQLTVKGRQQANKPIRVKLTLYAQGEHALSVLSKEHHSRECGTAGATS
jgi:hypothetical protein